MNNEIALYQLWVIRPSGQEFKVGEPDTEKRIDSFRCSQSGIGGNSYVSRPVPSVYHPPIKYRLRKHDWKITDLDHDWCSLTCNGKPFPLWSARHRIVFNTIHGEIHAQWIDNQDSCVVITLAKTKAL